MGNISDKEKEIIRKRLECLTTFAEYIESTDNMCDVSREDIDKYNEMITYFTTPTDDDGYKDPKTTFNFLDQYAQYIVEQYVEVGKAIEKMQKECPTNSFNIGSSTKDIEKMNALRDSYIGSMAIYNTTPGNIIRSQSTLIKNLIMGLDSEIDNADKSALRKMVGVKEQEAGIFEIWDKMINDKAKQYKSTLSAEDKRLFEIGWNKKEIESSPVSAKYSKLGENIKKYGKDLEDKHEIVKKDRVNKYVADDGMLKAYNKIGENVKTYLENNREGLNAMAKELVDIPSKKHINSSTFNEIVTNCNDLYEMTDGIETTGPHSVLNDETRSIVVKRNISATMARLENSMVKYLEDKWKPRKSPLGEQRFNKIFEILETVNPEKAQNMREFHAMKNASKKGQAVDFNTFCQNKKAEKECLSFKDLLQTEGSAKDFVVINKTNKTAEKTVDRVK